jgi:hypothetical protein
VHAGRRDGEDLGGGAMIWSEEEEPYGGVARVGFAAVYIDAAGRAGVGVEPTKTAHQLRIINAFVNYN